MSLRWIPVALTALAGTPAMAATCGDGSIYFDGACRGEAWFENLIPSDAVLLRVDGSGSSASTNKVVVVAQLLSGSEVITVTDGSGPSGAPTRGGYDLMAAKRRVIDRNASGKLVDVVTTGGNAGGSWSSGMSVTTWLTVDTKRTCVGGSCVTSTDTGGGTLAALAADIQESTADWADTQMSFALAGVTDLHMTGPMSELPEETAGEASSMAMRVPLLWLLWISTTACDERTVTTEQVLTGAYVVLGSDICYETTVTTTSQQNADCSWEVLATTTETVTWPCGT